MNEFRLEMYLIPKYSELDEEEKYYFYHFLKTSNTMKSLLIQNGIK